MKIKHMCFTFLILLCFACEINEIAEDKNVVIEDKNNLLLGNWVAPVYNQETTTFTRDAKLPDEGYGIKFQKDGNLIERTSGFCGTPPLTFFNVDGSYTVENDVIHINMSNYSMPYSWKIIKLTAEELVVKRAFSDQEKDHKALMTLFDEISNLANSKNCTDAKDWAFVAYGSKACGGPQGYLPYHKNIDVDSFFQKVESYTNAEKAFNIKWSIASDCALVNPPVSVDCQNGFPVLKY